MPQRKFLTITEQVAAHLREELQRGRWTTALPGRLELAAELGVSDQTAKAAIAQLEKEGILVPQGAGKRRRIELPKGSAMLTPSLRIAILVGEPADQRRDYVAEIKHQLGRAGHSSIFTPWFMPELGMNAESVARRILRTDADAWIVLSGARALLEWFVEHEVPAFGADWRAVSDGAVDPTQ